MTPEKVKEVAQRYEQLLVLDVGAEPARGPVEHLVGKWHDEVKYDHCLYMAKQIQVFVDENRMEKAMRWLGWLQAGLFFMGVFSIDEMGRHNMPPAE